MLVTAKAELLLPAYMATLKKFNVAVQVRDGLAYVYDIAADASAVDEPGRRCGYFTASGLIAGINKDTHNACSLLMDLCKSYGLKADFTFPNYIRLVRLAGGPAVDVVRTH